MKQNTLKTKPEPAYRTRLKAEKANELYLRIVEKLTKEKLYRDPSYNTFKLADDLNTNTRYIAAAVAVCTGDNYNALVNSLRLRDVCKMMRSAQYKDMTTEEIGLLAGFSSRQAFYLAFHRIYDCTPRAYRLQLNKQQADDDKKTTNNQ
uniref:helix-turn-helix domain-containing protein n=1 Tax=Alloprevotella sp. TaxID=1872471 RepID=UPI0015AF3563